MSYLFGNDVSNKLIDKDRFCFKNEVIKLPRSCHLNPYFCKSRPNSEIH